MGKIGNIISRLVFFCLFGSLFTFIIWGIKTWGVSDSFVSERTVIILLSIPSLIIIFGIVMVLGAIPKKKKKEEEIKDIKKIEFTTKEGEKLAVKSKEDLEWIPEEYREMATKFFEGIKKQFEKEKKE